MASNSENSVGDFRSNIGIPLKCFCGSRVRRFTSTTADNPGRPFCRCDSMPFKKDHLFKWVEEAMLEEIEDLKANVAGMQKEVNALTNNVDAMICGVSEVYKTVSDVNREHEATMMKLGFAFVACVIASVAIAKIV